jgi:DNA-binding NtrC family response regulator
MGSQNSSIPKILIADDQQDVLEALRLLLKGEGWKIEAAASPAAVMKLLAEQEFEVALIDLNYARDTTSGREGLDLMTRMSELDSSLPIVVMTAWGSVDVAVEAMRRGARDFIQKPWENARLLTILRTQIELSRALRQGQRLQAENEMLRENRGKAKAAKRRIRSAPRCSLTCAFWLRLQPRCRACRSFFLRSWPELLRVAVCR